MAKSQMRSNREKRKPKQDKSAVKDAALTTTPGKFPTLAKEVTKPKR